MQLNFVSRIVTQFRPMNWCSPSVCLSDVDILVNLCVTVLEFALQSGFTVSSGFLLFTHEENGSLTQVIMIEPYVQMTKVQIYWLARFIFTADRLLSGGIHAPV